jgi:hypothetical protein
MRIQIDWQDPIQLTRHKKLLVDEDDLPEAVANQPGVYFFSRRFGDNFEPFYIGEAENVRGRLKNHLMSKKIAFALLGLDKHSPIKGGERYFHFGYIKKKKGPDSVKKSLAIVERHLVRQTLAAELPLLNKKLTRFKTHSVVFSGSKKALAGFAKTAEIPE